MKRSVAVRVTGWALIALSPVILFGLVESCARIIDLQPTARVEAAVPAWLDRNILVKETRWIELLSTSPADLGNYYKTYRPDRYLFYRLNPNLDLPMTDVTAPPSLRERTRWIFHTNSKGYNAREARYEKPAGVYRIVTMGDSSTFGWGVDTAKIYPHVLESLLAARHPGMTFEVVNLGVCGYSSLQGRVLLRGEGLDWHPDLLVISYGSNDYSLVPESFERAYERNLGWSGALREALNTSRAYQVYASWLSAGVKSLAPAKKEDAGPQGVLNVGPDSSYENLVEMAQIARKRGIDPVFVSNCVPGEMAGPMRAAAEGTGVPMVDTQPLLEDALSRVAADPRFSAELSHYRELYGVPLLEKFPWLALYLTDECHPSSIGHRLIADALVPIVEGSPSFVRAAAGAR